jgi:hypothetical protein
VGGVVAGVPGIEGSGFGQGSTAVFGVVVATLPLVPGKGPEQDDPAGVEAFEEAERDISIGAVRAS